MTKRRQWIITITVMIALLTIAYSRFLWPGYVVSGDWYYPNPNHSLEFNGLTVFSPLNLNGYGGPALTWGFLAGLFNWLVTNWHWPLHFVTLLLYFLPALLVPTVGMWRLARILNNRPIFVAAATLLFVINSFFLTLLVGGHLPGAIAYGLLPWAIYYLEQLTSAPPSWSTISGLGLSLALTGIYEPRYLLLTGAVMLIWLLTRGRRRNQLSTLGGLAGAAFLFVLLSAYWLYGSFGVAGTTLTPPGYDDPGWLKALSYADFWHTLLLHHVWWPTGQTITAVTRYWYFALIPLLALLSWWNHRKRRLTLTLWLIVIVGIYLAKGINQPGGAGYRWLFTNWALFAGFRDPAKFFTLIAFGYSLLFAAGFTQLLTHQKKLVRASVWLVVSALFTVGFWPLWTQQVKGTLTKTAARPTELEEWFNSADGDWYRTFWVPGVYRYLSSDSQHSQVLANDTTIGRLRTRLYGLDRWLTDIRPADGRYLPYLWQSFGVKQVGIPGDTAGEFYSRSIPLTQTEFVRRVTALDLFNRHDIVTDSFNQTTHILTLPEYQPRIFTSQRLLITDRAEGIFWDYAAQPDPQNNTLIWADPSAGRGYEDAFALAQSAYLHPTVTSDGDSLQASFNIPQPGNYSLWLPSGVDSSPLRFNGQPLIPSSQRRQIGGQEQVQYNIQVLAAGEQRLELYFADLSSVTPDISSTEFSQWQPCTSRQVSFPKGLDDNDNRLALTGRLVTQTFQSTVTNTRCWQVVWPTPTAGYLWLQADISTSSENAYLYTNFLPQNDDRRPLRSGQEQLTWLVSAPRQSAEDKVTEIITAVVLPAGAEPTLTIKQLEGYALNSFWLNPEVIIEPVEAVIDRPTPVLSSRGTSFNGLTVTVNGNDFGLLLVTNNEYHQGWQLHGREGNNAVHFATLLEQNGWYLPPGRKGEFTLEFAPGKTITNLAWISGLTFAVLAAIFIWRRLGRKK